MEDTAIYSLNIKDPKETSMYFKANGNWVMKLTDKGIFFNRERYPDSSPDDFAQAVIGILETRFDVTFNKKQPPYNR